MVDEQPEHWRDYKAPESEPRDPESEGNIPPLIEVLSNNSDRRHEADAGADACKGNQQSFSSFITVSERFECQFHSSIRGRPWYSGSALDCWSTGRYCTNGVIQNKIHLITPSCPRPSIAFTVQIRGLKH